MGHYKCASITLWPQDIKLWFSFLYDSLVKVWASPLQLSSPPAASSPSVEPRPGTSHKYVASKWIFKYLNILLAYSYFIQHIFIQLEVKRLYLHISTLFEIFNPLSEWVSARQQPASSRPVLRIYFVVNYSTRQLLPLSQKIMQNSVSNRINEF